MGGRRRVLGALGGLAIALAGLAVLRPALLLEAEPIARTVEGLSEGDSRALLLAAGVLIGLYVVWAARSTTDERLLSSDAGAAERFDRTRDSPPELVTAEEHHRSARNLDRTVAFGVAGDGMSLEQVRSRLRELAAARLARTGDETSYQRRTERPSGNSGGPKNGPPGSGQTEPSGGTAVERRIGTGTWTDDRTAAAFLSGEEGPTQSLFSRLRLWLDPEAERERRIRRTVAAIESLGGADR